MQETKRIIEEVEQYLENNLQRDEKIIVHFMKTVRDLR